MGLFFAQQTVQSEPVPSSGTPQKLPQPRSSTDKIKICITIDHLNAGLSDSAYEYAKMLTDKGIPVTVFAMFIRKDRRW